VWTWTSKSNIFIFYSHTLPSPSPPPSSSPHETRAAGARRIQAALARSGAGRPPPPTATTPRRPTPSTLAPRASALAPQPSPAAKVAKSPPPYLAGDFASRRRLALAFARYLASSAHPANRRGRTWAGSLVVDNAAGRRRTWRLTARPGSGGRRGAGSASPLSSPLSLARARWIAVLQCTTQFCGPPYLVRPDLAWIPVREGASCKYTKMQTGRTDGLYMLLGFSKK